MTLKYGSVQNESTALIGAEQKLHFEPQINNMPPARASYAMFETAGEIVL